MEINILDAQVSVSGQMTTDDMSILKAQGVDLVVCNRPENESEDQTPFSDIAAAAKLNGIEIVNIPFSGGQMQPEQAEEFANLLAQYQRVHAYCRTGNRSSQLWAAAKK
jgi:uncharacterized protein (TIGR01244 family)